MSGEVDVAAHRDSYPMGNIHHGTEERPDWGTFCVECKQSWPCDVSILAERMRVVEGERDLYLRHIDIGTEQLTETTRRAESAEAALAALRAGVEALRLDLNADADYRVTKGSIGHRLRAFLATEASA